MHDGYTGTFENWAKKDDGMVGKYNPGDYTPKSWSGFIAGGMKDPGSLQRQYAPQQPPGMFMYGPGGSLMPRPGGTQDPNNPLNQGKIGDVRKEFDNLPEVQTYTAVLPLYDRTKTAPDNRAGDISIIYALGKMFDPKSVVRGSEIIMAQDSAPAAQKWIAELNSQLTGQGRLTPDMRKSILEALKGQVDSFRPLYERARTRYADYAQSYGATPDKIVGSDVADAYDTPTDNAAPEITEGTVIVNPTTKARMIFKGGKWQPL